MSERVALYGAAAVLRLALLAYGEWQDNHMAVKYTDVDYYVFSDATRFVADGASPFRRATYRYTPFLAWMLLPNMYNAVFGKALFALLDLVTALLMERILTLRLPGIAPVSDRHMLACLAFWLFNPFVFTVSTRGNADVLIACLVLGTCRSRCACLV